MSDLPAMLGCRMDLFPYPPLPIDDKFRHVWGAGPWTAEHDQLAWQDSRTGLHCAMIRHTAWGSWNGYVAVPPGHPLHGLSTDARIDPPDELGKVGELGRDFGALNMMMFLLEPAKTVPLSLVLPAHGSVNYADVDEQNLWWFGFDTGHGHDLVPAFARLGLGLGDRTYRDEAYVQGVTTRLAWALDLLKTYAGQIVVEVVED